MHFDFHVFYSDSTTDDACGAGNKTTAISTTTDAKVNSNTLTEGKKINSATKKHSVNIPCPSIYKTFIKYSSAGTEEDLILGVDKIAWPYILSGLWCAFFSLCYAVLGIIFNIFIGFDIERYKLSSED